VVGIYSFAALLLEGAGQIVYAIQVNLNPLLSDLHRSQSYPKVIEYIRRGNRTLLPLLLLGTGVGYLLFKDAVFLLVGNKDFLEARQYFLILMVGLSLASGHLLSLNALNQWGYPGRYSLMLLLMVGTNIALNLLFIPYFGGVGAAYATAVAFVLTVIYFRILLYRTVGVSPFPI
ncbi:MAG: polysaccharide biosynthesis C-terminal domain-containing protein, partial [Bdellovibrionales bacterium]|nr:polysaccharide biosynthesis C-terminal domain-containing protein [Bdellovibrionales bacterium]